MKLLNKMKGIICLVLCFSLIQSTVLPAFAYMITDPDHIVDVNNLSAKTEWDEEINTLQEAIAQLTNEQSALAQEFALSLYMRVYDPQNESAFLEARDTLEDSLHWDGAHLGEDYRAILNVENYLVNAASKYNTGKDYLTYLRKTLIQEGAFDGYMVEGMTEEQKETAYDILWNVASSVYSEMGISCAYNILNLNKPYDIHEGDISKLWTYYRMMMLCQVAMYKMYYPPVELAEYLYNEGLINENDYSDALAQAEQMGQMISGYKDILNNFPDCSTYAEVDSALQNAGIGSGDDFAFLIEAVLNGENIGLSLPLEINPVYNANQISADNPKHAKVYQQIWKEIFAKYGIDDDDFYDDLLSIQSKTQAAENKYNEYMLNSEAYENEWVGSEGVYRPFDDTPDPSTGDIARAINASSSKFEITLNEATENAVVYNFTCGNDIKMTLDGQKIDTWDYCSDSINLDAGHHELVVTWKCSGWYGVSNELTLSGWTLVENWKTEPEEFNVWHAKVEIAEFIENLTNEYVDAMSAEWAENGAAHLGWTEKNGKWFVETVGYNDTSYQNSPSNNFYNNSPRRFDEFVIDGPGSATVTFYNVNTDSIYVQNMTDPALETTTLRENLDNGLYKTTFTVPLVSGQNRIYIEMADLSYDDYDSYFTFPGAEKSDYNFGDYSSVYGNDAEKYFPSHGNSFPYPYMLGLYTVAGSQNPLGFIATYKQMANCLTNPEEKAEMLAVMDQVYSADTEEEAYNIFMTWAAGIESPEAGNITNAMQTFTELSMYIKAIDMAYDQNLITEEDRDRFTDAINNYASIIRPGFSNNMYGMNLVMDYDNALNDLENLEEGTEEYNAKLAEANAMKEELDTNFPGLYETYSETLPVIMEFFNVLNSSEEGMAIMSESNFKRIDLMNMAAALTLQYYGDVPYCEVYIISSYLNVVNDLFNTDNGIFADIENKLVYSVPTENLNNDIEQAKNELGETDENMARYNELEETRAADQARLDELISLRQSYISSLYVDENTLENYIRENYGRYFYSIPSNLRTVAESPLNGEGTTVTYTIAPTSYQTGYETYDRTFALSIPANSSVSVSATINGDNYSYNDFVRIYNSNNFVSSNKIYELTGTQNSNKSGSYTITNDTDSEQTYYINIKNYGYNYQSGNIAPITLNIGTIYNNATGGYEAPAIVITANSNDTGKIIETKSINAVLGETPENKDLHGKLRTYNPVTKECTFEWFYDYETNILTLNGYEDKMQNDEVVIAKSGDWRAQVTNNNLYDVYGIDLSDVDIVVNGDVIFYSNIKLGNVSGDGKITAKRVCGDITAENVDFDVYGLISTDQNVKDSGSYSSTYHNIMSNMSFKDCRIDAEYVVTYIILNLENVSLNIQNKGYEDSDYVKYTAQASMLVDLLEAKNSEINVTSLANSNFAVIVNDMLLDNVVFNIESLTNGLGIAQMAVLVGPGGGTHFSANVSANNQSDYVVENSEINITAAKNGLESYLYNDAYCTFLSSLINITAGEAGIVDRINSLSTIGEFAFDSSNSSYRFINCDITINAKTGIITMSEPKEYTVPQRIEESVKNTLGVVLLTLYYIDVDALAADDNLRTEFVTAINNTLSQVKDNVKSIYIDYPKAVIDSFIEKEREKDNWSNRIIQKFEDEKAVLDENWNNMKDKLNLSIDENDFVQSITDLTNIITDWSLADTTFNATSSFRKAITKLNIDDEFRTIYKTITGNEPDYNYGGLNVSDMLFDFCDVDIYATDKAVKLFKYSNNEEQNAGVGTENEVHISGIITEYNNRNKYIYTSPTNISTPNRQIKNIPNQCAYTWYVDEDNQTWMPNNREVSFSGARKYISVWCPEDGVFDLTAYIDINDEMIQNGITNYDLCDYLEFMLDNKVVCLDRYNGNQKINTTYTTNSNLAYVNTTYATINADGSITSRVPLNAGYHVLSLTYVKSDKYKGEDNTWVKISPVSGENYTALWGEEDTEVTAANNGGVYFHYKDSDATTSVLDCSYKAYESDHGSTSGMTYDYFTFETDRPNTQFTYAVQSNYGNTEIYIYKVLDDEFSDFSYVSVQENKETWDYSGSTPALVNPDYKLTAVADGTSSTGYVNTASAGNTYTVIIPEAGRYVMTAAFKSQTSGRDAKSIIFLPDTLTPARTFGQDKWNTLTLSNLALEGYSVFSSDFYPSTYMKTNVENISENENFLSVGYLKMNEVDEDGNIVNYYPTFNDNPTITADFNYDNVKNVHLYVYHDIYNNRSAEEIPYKADGLSEYFEIKDGKIEITAEPSNYNNWDDGFVIGFDYDYDWVLVGLPFAFTKGKYGSVTSPIVEPIIYQGIIQSIDPDLVIGTSDYVLRRAVRLEYAFFGSDDIETSTPGNYANKSLYKGYEITAEDLPLDEFEINGLSIKIYGWYYDDTAGLTREQITDQRPVQVGDIIDADTTVYPLIEINGWTDSWYRITVPTLVNVDGDTADVVITGIYDRDLTVVPREMSIEMTCVECPGLTLSALIYDDSEEELSVKLDATNPWEGLTAGQATKAMKVIWSDRAPLCSSDWTGTISYNVEIGENMHW